MTESTHKRWCPATTGGACICAPKPPRSHPDRYHRFRDSTVSKAQRQANTEARHKSVRFGLPEAPDALQE